MKRNRLPQTAVGVTRSQPRGDPKSQPNALWKAMTSRLPPDPPDPSRPPEPRPPLAPIPVPLTLHTE
ncbi:hypothetical protein E2C01_038740 [Portunus trituberculatus]|uniref:Uncharacterized protein n=1 Tax=Portunus trituberculatus TaxID=210409 RepID=A0A5B7FHR5_PORTR|nr:hypothetical protein [Portunus trituberculatus]